MRRFSDPADDDFVPPRLMCGVANLTPHEITFPDGTSLPPSGVAPRLEQTEGPAEGIETHLPVPVLDVEWGACNPALPQKKKFNLYIVPALVAQAHPDRTDLVCPRTERMPDGSIRCTALIRSATPAKRIADTKHAGRIEGRIEGVRAALRAAVRTLVGDPYSRPIGPERDAIIEGCNALREKIISGLSDEYREALDEYNKMIRDSE